MTELPPDLGAPSALGKHRDRLLLLLAAAAVLAVLLGLAHGQALLSAHEDSIVLGERVSALRGLARSARTSLGMVAGPAGAATAREQMERTRMDFHAALERTRALAAGHEPQLETLARAFDEVAAEGGILFEHLAAGRPEQAARSKESMDARLAALGEALDRLEQERLSAQLERARQLRRGEEGIAAAIVLLVLAAVGHARRLVRVVRAGEEERRRQMGSLERVNREHAAAIDRLTVLEAATRAVPSAILIADREGRVTWVNPATTRLTGYAEGELLGTRLGASSPETPSLADLARREVWEGHVVSRRKDGSCIVEEQTIAPVRGGDGALEHFVAVRRDVSRQRQAEDALSAAHDELRVVLDSITSILVVLDEEGRVRRWNLPAENTLGPAAAQAVGRRLEELTLPFDPSPLLAAVSACLAGQRDERLEDVQYSRGEGGTGFLGFTMSPLRDPGGASRGCLVLGRDITEKRLMETQLARAQKLESLGQLAAGIAHEINTPTQFVSDNASFLRSSLQELAPLLEQVERLRSAGAAAQVADALVDELIAAAERVDVGYILSELPKAIDDSLGGLERIAGIVRAMKEFSHPGSGQKEMADVNRCIRSTATVARNEWKYVAELVLELDPHLPAIPCYPQDLNQVLLNLIVNSAHAIDEQRKRSATDALGTITVGTRVVGDELEIRLSDTGCGIPPGLHTRVFDPFFTTKEVGKGTGQGLAITHQVVVQKHGGRITLESEIGRGTTFRVYLPLGEDPGQCPGELQEARAT